MRRIGIEIGGDYNSTAIKEATAALENMDAKVVAGANKSVERLTVQRQKLEQTAAAYAALAASAEKGSVQQVAAADLAAKAQRRLGTEVLATGAAVRTSARETALAQTEMVKFARGATLATGSFGKLGLGLALGSGGFLAGAMTVGGIKSTIDAARALIKNRQQLQVSLDNTGLSWQENRAGIEKYLEAEKKLSAFDDSELTGSLVGIVRATGDVATAERDVALAADIARGAHVDLASATDKLIGLESGRTRGVQALGIKLPIVKDAQDALRASGLQFTAEQKAQATQLDQVAAAHLAIIRLREKYSGAAKKYSESDASATDRLHVSVNSLQESIGTVLLPVVQSIAEPFSKWAQKEADSGDAARKTKEIVGDLTSVLKTAKGVIEDVDKVTGGFKQTLEILIGLKVATMFAGWVGPLQKVAGAMGGLRAGALELSSGAVLASLAVFGVSLGDAMAAARNQPNVPGFKKVPGGAGTGGGSYVGANGNLWIRDPAGNVTDTGIRANAANSGGIASSGGITTGPNQARIGGKSLAGEDPLITKGLQALANAGYSVNVTSAVRSFAKQAELYARYVKSGFDPRYIAAKPGTSDHESGHAADVLINGKAAATFGAAFLARYGLTAPLGMKDAVHLTALGGVGQQPAGGAATSSAIAAIIAQGKAKAVKPTIIHGAALIGDKLLAAITLDKNNATGSTGSIAEMWMKRELANLQKARGDVAAKLKGASPKQTAAVNAELRSIDTQIAGVNKDIATNLKAQATAIKSNAKTAIAADKAAIVSAFSNIINDAQTAFTAATSAYITGTLGPKFSQNGLLTPKEKQLADMQAADTAKSLTDGLAAAQKQLADDMNGALIEHIVDISTGATRDIFGPQGSASQIALDRDAVSQAQRMIDENELSIAATAERKDADKAYADAVTQYQQQRDDAEHAMTRELTDLGQGISDSKASINDLPGVLAKYGLTTGMVMLSSSGQFKDDMDGLSTAARNLADDFIAFSRKLGFVHDYSGADDAAHRAAKLVIPSDALTLIPGTNLNFENFVIASMLRNVPGMASGGDILRDGLIYAHEGERVQPAEVARGGGGGDIHFHMHADNYVGSQQDLARIIKSPAVVEAVSTAILLGNRRGHIRASQLN